MKLETAQRTAKEFTDRLSPACDRIEIVGSCKRGDKDQVHDIELLLILNGKHPRPEFGQKVTPPSILDKLISDMLASNILKEPQRKANGDRYKKFAIVEHSRLNDFCLDLFIVSPATWGIQNVIRTGPSLFSHSYVTNRGVSFYDHETNRRYHGLLPERYKYIRGVTRIMEGDTTLSLPEEKDALEILGLGWIEPKNRRNYIKIQGGS